jgi:tetratricopeptide (TPR) repeat protein
MKREENSRENSIQALTAIFHRGDFGLAITEARKVVRDYQSATAANILALAHKHLGEIDRAIEIYENLLINNPNNTMFLTNLGNIYADQGRLTQAKEIFEKALDVDPNHINAYLGLGNIHLMQAQLGSALRLYEKMQKEVKDIPLPQLQKINFRMAEIYRKGGPQYFDAAIKHYGLSNERLSLSHRLECVYRSKDQVTYEKEAAELSKLGHIDPLIAAVQTHASIRYGLQDKNPFCTDSFQYISQSKLSTAEGFERSLTERLLTIAHELESSPQELINKGGQSAGNLFLLNDPAIKKIKTIIESRITHYREHYQRSDTGLISKWPPQTTLHGWLIDLKKGGSLGSHMHKEGWLSGSLYLKLSKLEGSSEGNIIFDLDGGDYPTDGRDFPSKELNIEEGDIVLFPSSIFHKTVPFNSAERRVTLAFDVKPNLLVRS